MVKVPRRTETGEAPRWQGATTENTGQYLRAEQRSQHGCIARRMQRDFCHGLLTARIVLFLHDLRAQGLLQIGNQVVRIFEPDRDPHHAFRDAGSGQLLVTVSPL